MTAVIEAMSSVLVAPGHLQRECVGGAGPVRAPAIATSVATEGAARYEIIVVMAMLKQPGVLRCTVDLVDLCVAGCRLGRNGGCVHT